MRKFYIFILLVFCSALCFGQKPRFVIEAKGNAYYPVGDNFLKDGLENFFGYGVATEIVFFKNLGVGLEYGEAKTDVKNESVFGSFQNPRLKVYSIYGLYMIPIGARFETQAMIGYSALSLKSQPSAGYYYDNFTENGEGILLGAKFLYGLTKDSKLQLFVNPRMQFFRSQKVYFQNDALNDYYAKASLFNVNAGLRFNF